MSEDNDEKEKDYDADEILEEARKRFDLVIEQDGDNRASAKENIEFVYTPGKQWSDEVRTRRTQWKEQCLEFNQLKQFVHQVVNDQRQGRPGIRVHPANGEASKEVAEILQGLIRGIEYDSKAEAAYDNGVGCAVVGGRGWWGVCSEYDGDGFDQKLKIKAIADPMCVYADLDYQEPDGSDRRFVFVTGRCDKDEFEKKYPDADPISWQSIDQNWRVGENEIIIADYYRRVCDYKTLVLMSDGAQGYKEDLPEVIPDGITIVKERQVEVYRVEWYKIAGGNQVLEKYEWPGTIIPVVCTVGEDIIINGKRCYQGLINEAKDTQAMFNFGMTQQAQHLALTPKAPWVAATEAIKGYEEVYKNANVMNFSVMPFNHKDKNGDPIPPPQRAQPSLPDAGWINWCQAMTGLLRSTIGMYENSLGQRGIENSGRAIIAREKQGDNATFHFVDNLARAIALTGRILIELIPHYYDTERIIHIIGPDDTRKMVIINQTAPNPANPLEAIRNNDITTGQYAVTVEAGPSYATKRQETSDALLAFTKAFPPAAAVAGDLIVKSLDIADADVIAERLKLTLPPNIQQAESAKKEGKTPLPPEAMAQMQQLQQQLDQAVQTMHAMDAKNKELETGAQAELAKITAEQEAKQRELMMEKQIAEAKLATDYDIKMKQLELDRDIAIEKAKLAEQEAAFEQQLAQQKAQIAIDMERMKSDAKQQDIMREDGERSAEAEEKMRSAEQVQQFMAMQANTVNAIGALVENMNRRKKVTLPDGRVALMEHV